MLKKLRVKFIIINMSIVTVMLLIIFGFLYFSTGRKLEEDCERTLDRIATNPMHSMYPNTENNEVQLPYFNILIDPFGRIIDVGGDSFDLSNEDLLYTIINTIDSGSDEELNDYNLRYTYAESIMGRNYVFVDITSEKATLRNLVKNFAIIGSGAFLVFLLISIFLARLTVKPVEQAWKQQKQFIADASHELKTPLTVIMTDADLLNATLCSEEERTQLAGRITSMSDQMRGLVESMLTLARIDAGTVKQSKENVSLSEIVGNSAMLFEPVFFEKGMPFSFEIAPNIIINGIAVQLRQLVEILLDNAGKYARQGGNVVLRLQKTQHKKILLTVSNEGEPINPEDMKNLFKRFYRAEKARSMNHSYGLGLAIASSIVEEHHGRIWAESKNGYNSFFVEI